MHTQLALWVRNAEGAFIHAIADNPRIALMYRNEESRATYQFHGIARVTIDETERRKIYDRSPKIERDHDFAMMGAAVLIELTRIEGYAGSGAGGQMDRILMRADSE